MITLLSGVLLASPAAAQADKQLWRELTLDWIKSRTLTFGVDVEPKVLVSKPPDEPGWATLDVTPNAEFARGKWFDVVGEVHLGRTRQTDEQDSTEATPRPTTSAFVVSRTGCRRVLFAPRVWRRIVVARRLNVGRADAASDVLDHVDVASAAIDTHLATLFAPLSPSPICMAIVQQLWVRNRFPD